MSILEFLLIATSFGTSIWTFLDSTKLRENGDELSGLANTTPVVWFVGCLLLWIVVFPLYLFVRPQLIHATASGSHTDDLSRLEKLGDLRERGILTEEEFQQQKTSILEASKQRQSAQPTSHLMPAQKLAPTRFTNRGALGIEWNTTLSKNIGMLRDATVAYFSRTRAYPTWRFVIEMGLVSFLPKICFGMLVGIFWTDPTETNTELMISEDGIFVSLFAGLVIAPLLETAVGQWLPIFITGLFTNRVLPLVTASAIIFSLMHISWGLGAFLAIFPVSVFFAWCFLVGREQSYWKAYWTTSLAHSIHNAVAMGLFILCQSLLDTS